MDLDCASIHVTSWECMFALTLLFVSVCEHVCWCADHCGDTLPPCVNRLQETGG